jgi:hypothetical protein
VEVITIKLKRIFSMILVLIIATSTLVFAEDNALTVQDAIKTAMANSVDIMKYTNSIATLERNHREAIISSRQVDDLLEMDDRFRKLSRRSTRTPEEEMEFQMLASILKDYMSFEQRLNLEISSELSPSNMEYMVNVNKGLLKSTKDNIYLTIYRNFNNISKIEDSIMIKNSLISNLESNLRYATAKFSLGKLSSNSLSLIKLDMQKAKIELNKLQIEKQKYIIELNKNLGIPLDSIHAKYVNDEIPKDITAKSLQEYTALAFTNRDDVMSAKKYYEIKQKEYDITKIYYYYDTEVAHMNAQVALNDAKDKLDSTEINAQIQVMNAYNSFQSQLTNHEKNKISRDLNEKTLQETRSRYNLGLTTELELNKANINYSQSQLAYLSSARDTWLAKLNLDLACGIVINNNN